MTGEGLQMVRGRLEAGVLASFKGQQGERDLEVLVTVGLKPQKRAESGEFSGCGLRQEVVW